MVKSYKIVISTTRSAQNTLIHVLHLQESLEWELLVQKRSVRQWAIDVLSPNREIGTVGLYGMRDMLNIST